MKALADAGSEFRVIRVDNWGEREYNSALTDSLEAEPFDDLRHIAREYMIDCFTDVDLPTEDIEWLMPNWDLNAVDRLLSRMEIDEVSSGD